MNQTVDKHGDTLFLNEFTVVASHPDGTEFFDSPTKRGAYRKFWAWVDRSGDEYPELERKNWRKTGSVNDYDWWKWEGE